MPYMRKYTLTKLQVKKDASELPSARASEGLSRFPPIRPLHYANCLTVES